MAEQRLLSCGGEPVKESISNISRTDSIERTGRIETTPHGLENSPRGVSFIP